MATIKLALKDLTLAEQIPGLCLGCAKPTVETQQRQFLVGWRSTVKFDVPYCSACVGEHRAYELNTLYLGLCIFAAVIAFVGGAIAWMTTKIMALGLAGLGVAVLAGIFGLRFFMKRHKPKTCTGEVLDANEQRVTLVDVHDQFAAALEALRKRKVGGPKR